MSLAEHVLNIFVRQVRGVKEKMYNQSKVPSCSVWKVIAWTDRHTPAQTDWQTDSNYYLSTYADNEAWSMTRNGNSLRTATKTLDIGATLKDIENF